MKAGRARGDPVSRRGGFTLIELLTTIGIVAFLAALIVPAVQMARESARRTQCATHLHQIGLALASYASGCGSFPGATNGLGYSAHSLLLPYLDQRTLFNGLNFSVHAMEFGPGSVNQTAALTSLAIFLCPTDPPPGAVTWSSNYPVSRGVWRRNSTTVENGAFSTPRAPWATLPSFTDGMSTTAAVSEWVVGPLFLEARDPKGTVYQTPDFLVQPNQFDQFARECHNLDPATAKIGDLSKGLRWFLGDYSSTNYNHILGPNDHSCTPEVWAQYGAFPASSRHPGGVNLLFADGHVTFASQGTSIGVWRAIGTRNGAEVEGQGGL